MSFSSWIKQDRSFFAWLPAILWAVIVLFLSVIPYGITPALTVGHFDKLCHFGAYGFFAFLLVWGIKRAHMPPRMKYMAFTLIFVSCYGILIEILQGFIPGRHACVVDAVFNILGAAAGILTGRIFLWRK